MCGDRRGKGIKTVADKDADGKGGSAVRQLEKQRLPSHGREPEKEGGKYPDSA